MFALIMSQKPPPVPCITSADAAGGGRKPTARLNGTSAAAAHSCLGRGLQGSHAVSSPACAMLHDHGETSPTLAPSREGWKAGRRNKQGDGGITGRRA